MNRLQRVRTQQSGFTYLMLLWWVAISGVMLMALAQRWSIEAQRQKEMELVFRGNQIKRAIEAYAKVPVKEAAASNYPPSLEDLLEDKRLSDPRHHLRRLWPDPLTGGAWGLIKDKSGIKGVYSTAGMAPLRAPDGILRFSEWRFEAAGMAPKTSMTPGVR